MESFEDLLAKWLTTEEAACEILRKKPTQSSPFPQTLATALGLGRNAGRKDSQLSVAYANLLISLMVRLH